MATMLTNLVNPEVYADFIDKKLTDYIKFAPLATVDYTLVGKPGDTVYVPTWSYIGAAQDLAEFSSVVPATLSADTASVTIKKAAKGVELTDEAVLSGLGDPIGESVTQIVTSMGDKVDIDIVATLHNITGTMLYETAASTTNPTASDIFDALELFGEDIDGVKVVAVEPAIYTEMRKNTATWIPASEMAAGIAVRGVVGEYAGCQVMVTNRVKTSHDMYIIKPGAIRIYLKRDTQVETDRDILKFTTVITASKHYAVSLYDASKAVRIATKSA